MEQPWPAGCASDKYEHRQVECRFGDGRRRGLSGFAAVNDPTVSVIALGMVRVVQRLSDERPLDGDIPRDVSIPRLPMGVQIPTAVNQRRRRRYCQPQLHGSLLATAPGSRTSLSSD